MKSFFNIIQLNVSLTTNFNDQNLLLTIVTNLDTNLQNSIWLFGYQFTIDY